MVLRATGEAGSPSALLFLLCRQPKGRLRRVGGRRRTAVRSSEGRVRRGATPLSSDEDGLGRRARPRWQGVLAAGLVVALVAAIGAGLLVHGRSSSSTLAGRVAPDFRLADLRETGRTVSLSSLRGRTVAPNLRAALSTA